jgi:hypothetical protein
MVKRYREIQRIKANSKKLLRELRPLLAGYSKLNNTLHNHFFPPPRVATQSHLTLYRTAFLYLACPLSSISLPNLKQQTLFSHSQLRCPNHL